MKHRLLGRTGIPVSEIGLGCEHLQKQGAKEVADVVAAALDHEINIMDVFMSEPNVRSYIGAALKGRRDKAVIQGHIGSTWVNDQYLVTQDPALCRTNFEDFLTRMQTDYVDIGMLHFLDTEEGFDAAFNGEMLQYAISLKEKGIIRAIGMSSHNPVIASKAVETGYIDVLMFSLNPAYDLLPEQTHVDNLFKDETYRQGGLSGINPVRAGLYELCERKGTAITVMKSLAAGTLLKAELSPFGCAMTPEQCCHYALTRPAVASVLVGCRTPEEVERAVAYETASDSQKDYAEILSKTPRSMKGACMYCNHCHPCPAQLDVASINKYLDLAEAYPEIPDTVKAHYQALSGHGSDCIGCGDCETRCPFEVPVRERMERAVKVFGL